MNIIRLIIVLSISIFILYFLVRNYNKGLALTVFFLILLPNELCVELGADLPTITAFRAIILVVTFYSLYKGKLKEKCPKMPILNILIVIFFSKLASLIFAFKFAVSLNGIIVFAIETLLLFVILTKAVNDRQTIISIMYGACSAIFLIAILGLIERYTKFNPVDYIVPSNDPRFDPDKINSIYSTLAHPIHFGTALAMGWPICLYILDKQDNPLRKNLFFICTFLIYGGLYFSGSRGPWLGFCVALILLIVFKFPRIKQKTLFIVYLVILILMMRPGIYETISGLWTATFDVERIEGSSFYYRFELLKVAFREVIKFPERLAFGYGDGSAQVMDLRGMLSYGSGREVNFWSWDNHFAVMLLHEGLIGLILHLILYFLIFYYLIKGIKLIPQERSLMIALIASNAVLIFMMTNVALFSPQLGFIFWTNTAIGLILSQKIYKIKT